jgi:hypothetical protein
MKNVSGPTPVTYGTPSYRYPVACRTARGAALYDEAWATFTKTLEAKHSPSLWATLETIKPITHARGMKLVKVFWNKVCTKHNTHAYIETFSDEQPNTQYKRKYDWHSIVCWIGDEVEPEVIAKMWQAYINKIMFQSNRDETLVLEMLAARKYAADIQSYKKKVPTHTYNHCWKYAYKHEWLQSYVACWNKKSCKKNGCIHSNYGDDI